MSDAPLLQLPPPPAHVLMPTKPQLQMVSHLGIDAPPINWMPGICDTCGGKGRFSTWLGETGDTDRIGVFECPCKDQLRLYRYFAFHGLHMAYSRFRLLDIGGWPADDPRREWVVRWITAASDPETMGFFGSTLFGGRRGTGKTLSMALVAKMMMLYKVDVQWLNSATLTNNQVHWVRDDNVRRWWTKRVRGAEVLFIDGLGAERGNEEYVLNRLIDLIEHRMNNLLPTFISTSKSPDQLAMPYEKIFERMMEMCPPVSFNHADSFSLKDLQAEKQLGIARPAIFLAVS